MLRSLTIRNFTIIEHLELRPGLGLNVLTGETGAGKSMVIDALEVLLGGRAEVGLVRAGCDAALVEGVFEVEPEDGVPVHEGELAALLAEQGIPLDDGLVIASREVARAGKSVGRMNGRAVPSAVMRATGELLVDIHGQSDHLSLLRPTLHLDFLDRFAGTIEFRAELREKVLALRRVREELARLRQDERELARRLDLLRFQAEEIEAAKLVEGEEEELETEHRRLSNAEALSRLGAEIHALLSEGVPGKESALDVLGAAAAQARELARLDPAQHEFAAQLENVAVQVQELAHQMRSYWDGVELNPARLAGVEERLDLIQRLKRKYGNSIGEVLSFGRQVRAELESIIHSEERLAELQAEEERLLEQVGVLAGELSLQRQAAAQRLEAAVEEELEALSLRKARFAIAIEQRENAEGIGVQLAGSHAGCYAFDQRGIDEVEFQLAVNPGEPLKPLAKVASGGETSRLLLALKAVLSQADPVPILIFDEIDIGVGGRSGQVVGQKLWELARRHQVLCITHLPQVAAYADQHFTVAKALSGDKTTVTCKRLDGRGRIEEIAQMVGKVSVATLRSADEMLQQANEWKAQRRVAGVGPAPARPSPQGALGI